MVSFVPYLRRNIKQIRQTQRERAVAQCLTFTHSRSRPQTVYLVQWLQERQKCPVEKLELKTSVWGQAGLTVMRHRGALSEPRQKTPLESVALAGEVPILLSFPSGFHTPSGSVLLLATDQ